MKSISQYFQVVIPNMNGINYPIKRYRLHQKTNPNSMLHTVILKLWTFTDLNKSCNMNICRCEQITKVAHVPDRQTQLGCCAQSGQQNRAQSEPRTSRSKRKSSGDVERKGIAKTMETKIKSVERLALGENMVDIICFYNTNGSTPGTILKNQDKIMEHVNSTVPVKLLCKMHKQTRFINILPEQNLLINQDLL